MKQGWFEIVSNNLIARDVYKMVLDGDATAVTMPGQFVNIKIEGLFLRRPISICDYTDDSITIIYKVVGRGTEIMCKMGKGTKLDLLVGLGNGFDAGKDTVKPLLVGGGIGTPPLYKLCKDLLARGIKPQVVLGFNSKADVFYEEEFKALGVDVAVTTVDGSYGIKGYVGEEVARKDYDFFYTCGPEPMLRALSKVVTAKGQYSFEERMGCGFGACMGCSCKTLAGNKRICKDGPVMESEVLIWEN